MAQPVSPPTENKEVSRLRERLSSRLDKTRLDAFTGLVAQGSEGLTVLQEALLAEQASGNFTWLSGSIYQLLSTDDSESARAFLAKHFPDGLLPLTSGRFVDYSHLQQLLVEGQYKQADIETIAKICELAGEAATKRKWIYFSEVDQLPTEDLETLDLLWRVYSQGRFGFSVQREIWLGSGQVWEQLWPKLGWKDGNTWTRYPGSFTWDLTAPRGHLPLTNQLRGVRVMDALMNHPAFSGAAANHSSSVKP